MKSFVAVLKKREIKLLILGISPFHDASTILTWNRNATDKNENNLLNINKSIDILVQSVRGKIQ